ncbi:MAG: HEAT repeat domain-containing protein [Planctomycetota bacterium]|jgi:HEAT repeat protein
MNSNYDTFEHIVRQTERVSYLPSEEACRRLFNPCEDGWLKACRHWIQQEKLQSPQEVYPDLERIQDPNHTWRLEIAHLHLLCTQMVIQAQQLCQTDGADCKEHSVKLLETICEALAAPESARKRHLLRIDELARSCDSDSPQSVIHRMLRVVADSSPALTREQAPTTWHLRRVSWLYELVLFLLDNSHKRLVLHRTSVPIALVPVGEQGSDASILAELDFEVLPDGRGEVFVTPEQAFVGLERGFDDLLDVAATSAWQLIRDEQTTDVKPDVRVKINRLEIIEEKGGQRNIEPERRLLDNDVLEGRSATAAGAIGLYYALIGKVYDPRVIILAELNNHGNIGPVDHIDTKIRKVSCSGMFDTVVVAKANEDQARKELAKKTTAQLLTALTLEELVNIRSLLVRDVLKYLKNLAKRSAVLPKYYPEHLQKSCCEGTAFDKLWQTARVIANRSRLDRWLARQRDQMSQKGLAHGSIVFGFRRSALEDDPRQNLELEIETLDWDEHESGGLKRAVILGDPGFGKTWLLRNEARRHACKAIGHLEKNIQTLDEIVLPMYCRLSDLACSQGTLQEALADRVVEEHSSAFRCFVLEKLYTCRCVLLLDAWDEVPDKLPLKKRIDAFARQFTNPRIVLTSRKFGYETTLPPLPKAKELELLSFRWSQVEAFVRVWFGEDDKAASSFLARLKQRRQVKNLAKIPLMLSMICRTCQDGNLPSRRSELYEVCLKGLLKDWIIYDEKLGIAGRELDNAYVEVLLKRLGNLALELFCKGYEQFSESMLIDMLSQWFDDEKSLELIRLFKCRGIFVASNSSNDPPLLFLHKTFHEYLAARALAKEPDSFKAALEHVYDRNWHNVLILLGGLFAERTGGYLAALLKENKNDFLCRPLLLAVGIAMEAGRDRLPESVFSDLADVMTKICLGKILDFLSEPATCVMICMPESCEAIALELMESRDIDQRVQAVDALGYIGSEQAVRILIRALEDEDHWVRLSAIEALKFIGSEQAVGAIIEALKKNEDEVVRCYAAKALGEFASKQAIVALIKALPREKSEGRRYAARALGQIGSEQEFKPIINKFIGLCIEDLKDEQVQIRGFVAEVLGYIGSDQAVEGLKEALNDENFLVYQEASNALGRIGSDQAVEILTEALTYGTFFLVRSHAAEALGKIGSPEAIPALLRALNDDEPHVRWSAANALGYIGSEKALEALMNALQDETVDIRSAAAMALGAIGSDQVLEALTKALKDKDESVRMYVALAMGWIGSKQVVEVLKETLRDEYRGARGSAAGALGRIGSEHAVQALINVLKDKEQLVRRNAVRALGRIGSKSAVGALIEVLKDKDMDTAVRISAAISLGRIGSGQAIESLVQTALKKKYHWETLAAVGSLFSICNEGCSPMRLENILPEKTRNDLNSLATRIELLVYQLEAEAGKKK